MNINSQLGLATYPIPVYNKSVDQQLGFIGSDGQGMMFNADGDYWADKLQPNTSDDTLLMLNEDSNFLNAGGGSGGNSSVDRETRIRSYAEGTFYDQWNASISAFKIDDSEPMARVKGTFTTSLTGKNNIYAFLNELKFLKTAYEDGQTQLYDELKKYNITSTGAITKSSTDYTNRKEINHRIWLVESKISKLKDLIASVEKQIETAKVKADNDAFSKAQTTNTIESFSDYIKNFPEGLSVDKANKAIENIKVKEKIKALEDSKKNATPEEKKQIDAEIDRLLGVSSGTTGTIATRMFLYGGVALVGVYILYKVFRGNSTSVA